MINKTLLATAAVGGAALVALVPASAGTHRHGGVAEKLCAAPWHWNGPLSLLHEGHAPGYAACDDHGRGGSDISVLNDVCSTPWHSNGPLEILTVDHTPSSAACDRDPAG